MKMLRASGKDESALGALWANRRRPLLRALPRGESFKVPPHFYVFNTTVQDEFSHVPHQLPRVKSRQRRPSFKLF